MGWHLLSGVTMFVVQHSGNNMYGHAIADHNHSVVDVTVGRCQTALPDKLLQLSKSLEHSYICSVAGQLQFALYTRRRR